MRFIIDTKVKRETTSFEIDEESCIKAIHIMRKLAETLPTINQYDMTFSWVFKNNRLHPKLQLEQNHIPGKLRRIIIDFTPDCKSATGTVTIFSVFTEFEKSNEPVIDFAGHGFNAFETATTAMNNYLDFVKQTV